MAHETIQLHSSNVQPMQRVPHSIKHSAKKEGGGNLLGSASANSLSFCVSA